MTNTTGKDFKFKTPIFNKKKMRLLGAHLVNEYRKVTFNKGNPLMANNQPFPSYSSKYRKAKESGKLKRSDTSYKSSKAPYLTGDLMRDLKASHNPRKNSFSIGWSAEADKVDQLNKMGRILTSHAHPVNPKVMANIMPHIGKFLNSILINGTQHIKIKDKK